MQVQSLKKDALVSFKFPALNSINEKWQGNIIQQFVKSSFSSEASIENYSDKHIKGFVITPIGGNEKILLTNKTSNLPSTFEKIIHIQTKISIDYNVLSQKNLNSRWLKHPKLIKKNINKIDFNNLLKKTIDSWNNTFLYKKEVPRNNKKGLRSAQIGAIHAVHAHWSVSEQDATVVMPTGIGKTETMLSILVSKQCEKLLVIVPTNILRIQIANKFRTLGILKEIGVVASKANNPIIGVLRHKPKKIEDVDYFFSKCNVIVTTMKIASECEKEIQDRMADYCPYLFIDEAHHIAANKWNEFKKIFESKKILQFTATPFRNDDRPIGGEIIFNYTLKKAQEDGYFKKIRFKPIREFDLSKADEVIAQEAVKQLKEDLKKYNHTLMARVKSIKRAEEVFSIYKKYKEFNPVQIHTGMKSREREITRKKIINGDAKIVVCVDMLGEGFDLPELKIAAFHDIKKSLPITLQIAGRFTRAKSDLGDPTFIANIVDPTVSKEIENLYSHGADWNIILRESSQEVTQKQIDFFKFLKGFSKFPEDILIQNLRPAISTVIYKIKNDTWNPNNFMEGLPGALDLDKIYYDINRERNTLVIITTKKGLIKWAQDREIYNWDWELLIVFCDKKQQLLFINSSTNFGYYNRLAEAVSGKVKLVRGPMVFRSFSGINRLKFQNIGLLELFGRLIRYTMRAGSDVGDGITEAQKQNVIKSNFFGTGYEEGNKTSVGCTYKGRIWSHKIGNVETLTKWCSTIGKKVLDETIDPDDILKGTLEIQYISTRPNKMPIGIEWPEEIYRNPERFYSINFGNKESIPLCLIDIGLQNPREIGDLKFYISTDEVKIEFILSLFEKNGGSDFKIAPSGKREVYIQKGLYKNPINEFFYKYPPIILFHDGSALEGNCYIELNKIYPPYPKDKIIAWDWTGIDIKKESQGIEKVTNSIQYHVIDNLNKKRDFDIIFNDDGPGEISDIIGILTKKDNIFVELYHCKFSKESTPGARSDDLYIVCGQAQKSIHWKEKQIELFSRMIERDIKMLNKNKISRFEKGTRNELHRIMELSRYVPIDLKIFVVQPGLSKEKADIDQLSLLSVTENYLMETYKLPFCVIASP